MWTGSIAWHSIPCMKRPTPAETGSSLVLLGEIAALFESAGLTMLGVSCNRCERRGRLAVARLLAAHGPALPGPELRRILAADCPRMIAGKIPDQTCTVSTSRRCRCCRGRLGEAESRIGGEPPVRHLSRPSARNHGGKCK